MQVQEITVLVATALGAWTDIRTGKIPNALTYPLWVFGWVYAGLAAGRSGLIDSLSGFLLAFIPCFLLYLTGGLGGGDVKLMAAVGALMGWRFTASAMLSSIFVGALIAVLIVVWEGRILATFKFLCQRLSGFGARAALDVETQVPFGVAICLACAMTLIESWHGGRPLGLMVSEWAGAMWTS